MKKLITLILVAVMMLSMTAVASAARDNEGKGLGTEAGNVTVNIVVNTTTVYYVTIGWDLDFQYTFSAWDGDSYGGEWTENEGSITVTNKSNVAIKYSVGAFVPVAEYDEISMGYKKGGVAYTHDTDVTVDAISIDAGGSATGDAPKSVITVTADGRPNARPNADTAATVGTITVTVKTAATP